MMQKHKTITGVPPWPTTPAKFIHLPHLHILIFVENTTNEKEIQKHTHEEETQGFQLGGNHNIRGRMSGWEGGKLSGVSIGAEQTPQLPRN